VEEKIIHFVSGLPRAGSTLLCNILAQNPRFFTTATSGILEVIFAVRNMWENFIEFRASPDDEAKMRVMRSILFSFHGNGDRPVVFDKSRGWLGHLELAEALLGRKAKVLVPVRDLKDVLASFEKLYRRNAHIFQTETEKQLYYKWQTIKGRIEIWSDPSQPVGLAFNRIQDALVRGFSDRMHFVRYEELTRDPEGTMKSIYQFLGEDSFDHNFEYVEQVTHENDFVHGFRDLHEIRPKVEPQPSQWRDVLGDAAKVITAVEPW